MGMGIVHGFFHFGFASLGYVVRRLPAYRPVYVGQGAICAGFCTPKRVNYSRIRIAVRGGVLLDAMNFTLMGYDALMPLTVYPISNIDSVVVVLAAG